MNSGIWVGNLKNRCFCWFPAAIFVPRKGTPTWRLIQSLINLGKPFFRISHICNIAQTWFLARLFVYLSSFISQILDFLYWLVCIFIFDGVTVKTENSITNQYMLWCWQNLDQTNLCYPIPIFLSFRELQGYIGSRYYWCLNHYSHRAVIATVTFPAVY